MKLNTRQIERNQALAEDLKQFILDNHIGYDTRIYFNGICYGWEVGYYDKEPRLIRDIKPSEYFEYAEDDSVSMSFEGYLYNILNYNEFPQHHITFDKIFEKHNCYYELGNSWNLAVYWLEDN